MANIFADQRKYNEKRPRNNHDLSFKSNGTFKIGCETPVFTRLVYPGDTFDMDVAYNLKLMPLVFPVQSRVRAQMSFFYVPLRILWKNWKPWIEGLYDNTTHPHPYISVPDSELNNGSIHDWFGLQTSIVSHGIYTQSAYPAGFSVPNQGLVYKLMFRTTDSSSLVGLSTTNPAQSDANFVYKAIPSGSISSRTSGFTSTRFVFKNLAKYMRSVGISDPHFSVYLYYSKFEDIYSDNDRMANVTRSAVVPSSDVVGDDFVIYYTSSVFSNLINEINSDSDFKYMYFVVELGDYKIPSTLFSAEQYACYFLSANGAEFMPVSQVGSKYYSNVDLPNVLPYRAYEAIHNAYYRNWDIDPLMIDGEVAYEKYVPNDGDGLDRYPYALHYHNYEYDFLTSALPSPQQGVAPLVGMSALGDVTIEDENGITTAKAEIADDGTITNMVLTSPAASNTHARRVVEIAQAGMNINDFRSTNALTRLLETSLRKGHQYLPFLGGHWDVEPSEVEVDMPQYIGGFSRDVNISTVVSQADTLGSDGKALGDFGAYGSLTGGTNGRIRHFCKDYGFIMGILTIIPTPAYSQLQPKHMLCPTNFLDYYFNEMSEIGMQPITYREVTPVTAYMQSLYDGGVTSVHDTFGYQRPNYDLVSSVDEVHGEFRGSLRHYLINRVFDGRPVLGKDFITINPAEINDVFVNTNPSDDTVIGEIAFSIHAKRPVPRVVIPSLGR